MLSKSEAGQRDRVKARLDLNDGIINDVDTFFTVGEYRAGYEEYQ